MVFGVLVDKDVVGVFVVLGLCIVYWYLVGLDYDILCGLLV